MAMNALMLSALQQMRPHLPTDASICCLGYPDVLVSREQAAKILGVEAAARLAHRTDSAQILAWHRLETQLDRVIDAESLFAVMELKLTVVDLVASRGGERIVDLNDPLPADLVNAFHIVLDAGTMEHCFNVGQTIRNILDMTRIDGFVIHVNPMTMVNHGFFNFSPTFYHDFYGQNGHQLVAPICGVAANGIHISSQQLHPTRRQQVPDSAMVMCIARKKHGRAATWPTQTKYLNNPTLKAEGNSAVSG